MDDELEQTGSGDVGGSSFTGKGGLQPIGIAGKKKKRTKPKFGEEQVKMEELEFIISKLGNIKELSVVKRGDRWCVVHGHPQKPGSPTDKPPGTIIKCFPTKAQAEAMHRAIIISQIKRKSSEELSCLSNMGWDVGLTFSRNKAEISVILPLEV